MVFCSFCFCSYYLFGHFFVCKAPQKLYQWRLLFHHISQKRTHLLYLNTLTPHIQNKCRKKHTYTCTFKCLFFHCGVQEIKSLGLSTTLNDLLRWMLRQTVTCFVSEHRVSGQFPDVEQLNTDRSSSLWSSLLALYPLLHLPYQSISFHLLWLSLYHGTCKCFDSPSLTPSQHSPLQFLALCPRSIYISLAMH